MKQTGSAVWKGGIKDGKGIVSTGSETLKDVPYDFKMRFEGQKGTTPEELVAAAHAACFSMALSLFLGEAGMAAESLETKATVTLEQVGGGFDITSSHLELTAKIPNANKEAFAKAVETAKTGCPISKLYKTKITLDSKLV